MIPTDKSKEVDRLFRVKAGDSFRARFDLLLYHRIGQGNDDPISPTELEDFEISEHEDILKEYIEVYWQEEVNYELSEGKTIDQVYKEMKEWRVKHKDNIAVLREHYIINIFKGIFPFKAFEEFYNKERKCDYCNITPSKIEDLISGRKLYKKHITRGWTLEIDRIEPNLEYTEDNCVWSCYWCNNSKTDEFTYDEFKKIGAVLEELWHDRENQ